MIEIRKHKSILTWLLVAQFGLLGVVGILAILAPVTLLFRAVWWTCVLVGAFAFLLSVITFFSSRRPALLWVSVASLLGLAAATPASLWLIGLDN